VQLQWVSAGGFPGWSGDDGGGVWAGLKALLLPALSLAAVQHDVALTDGDGRVVGGSTGVGVVIGLAVILDSATATSSRDITASGNITFDAHLDVASAVTAEASQAGAPPDKNKKADDQIGEQKGLAAQQNSSVGNTTTPTATTSSGSVGVGAAVAVCARPGVATSDNASGSTAMR